MQSDAKLAERGNLSIISGQPPEFRSHGLWARSPASHRPAHDNYSMHELEANLKRLSVEDQEHLLSPRTDIFTNPIIVPLFRTSVMRTKARPWLRKQELPTIRAPAGQLEHIFPTPSPETLNSFRSAVPDDWLSARRGLPKVKDTSTRDDSPPPSATSRASSGKIFSSADFGVDLSPATRKRAASPESTPSIRKRACRTQEPEPIQTSPRSVTRTLSTSSSSIKEVVAPAAVGSTTAHARKVAALPRQSPTQPAPAHVGSRGLSRSSSSSTLSALSSSDSDGPFPPSPEQTCVIPLKSQEGNEWVEELFGSSVTETSPRMNFLELLATVAASPRDKIAFRSAGMTVCATGYGFHHVISAQ
jgi:hypothetical protein